MLGDEKSVLAFGSVDVNDLVLFYPVVASSRRQHMINGSAAAADVGGKNAGKALFCLLWETRHCS